MVSIIALNFKYLEMMDKIKKLHLEEISNGLDRIGVIKRMNVSGSYFQNHGIECLFIGGMPIINTMSSF